MPTLKAVTRRSKARGPGGAPPAPFSPTVQIARSADKLVMDSGGTVTVTYTISGSGTTTAQLIRTDGSAPVALTCDGAQHTVAFSATLSQVYHIAAQDANGPVIDRLEIIARHTLTAVDPTASPTIVVQRSGNWIDTNPATSPWPGGVLPGVNDIVSNTGWTVTCNSRVDGSGNILQCARFINNSGGVLRLWNDNGTAAALWLTDYHGKAGSLWDQDSTFTPGTVAVLILRNRPFHANDTAGNSPDGFANFWNAFYIKDGDLRMRGTAGTPFVRAAGHLTAGDTHIDLYYPVTGWAQGSFLVIPDSRGALPHSAVGSNVNKGERAIVRGVGPDGAGRPNQRVHLMRPLVYDHPGAVDVSGALSVRPWDRNGVDGNNEPLAPHVININKTCAIVTEDATGISGAYAGGQPRAHIMLQGGGRVDCREAMVGHGTGRMTLDYILADNGGSMPTTNQAAVPKYYRTFPLLTYDLHGPVGGLGYDAGVDEPEFKPGDPANIFGLDGPSHRFVNCDTIEPVQYHGAGADQQIGTVPLAAGGIAHVNTCYGLYKGCIGFNFAGTCWLVSDGTVRRNVFVNNIVSRSDGNGARIDINSIIFQGSTWVWGCYENWVRNNVCADTGGFHVNENYGHSWINVGHTAKVPNFQGASQLDAANCTDFDNSASKVLQWDNWEAYGNSRHVGIYFLGTTANNFTPLSTTDQVITRETAWAWWETGMIPYGQYRVVKDRWFIRADYVNASYNMTWQGSTDYGTMELTWKDTDCEGPNIFMAQPRFFGVQNDADQPDRYGPGRMITKGGRFAVDTMLLVQSYFGTSGRASLFYGHRWVFGGVRQGGGPSDACTLISTGGGRVPTYVRNQFELAADFRYNQGWTVVSEHTIEVNRVGGRNYDVYLDNQDPSETLVRSDRGNNGSSPGDYPTSLDTARTWGAPESGMTNQQCHDKYEPLPAHFADATLTDFLGVLKAGWPNSATPGRCWGGKLTPATAATKTWLDGSRGASSAKADDAGASS